MIVEDQSDVIAFLADARAYGEGVDTVERIETHISEIFLAGERAYKLKRAVKYPYLDFSTVALRRAACEAEVAINRRTAPRIYLGTAAVTRNVDGRMAIDGEGAAIDWLVVMRRFDQDSLLDRLATRGALDPALIAELADAVARLHADADRRPDMGGAAAMAETIDNTAAAFAELEDGVLDAARVARLDARLRQALARVAPLLDRRRDAGMVRHCHGDLHLRNVFLDDGVPTLFDAIEFSEPIACIDVFYDFAFLVMDLLHRGLRPLANAALNRYLERTRDDEGLALLPLFLSCRAAIRAYVAGATLATAGSDADARQRMREDVRAYLDLALDCLAPPPPRLVAIGGLSGSGKSTLARALAPDIGAAPGAVILRSDVTRKGLAGVESTERLPEEAYAEAMTDRVYRTIAERARAVLDAGHSVVADAVYARPEQRAAIAAAAAGAEAPFAGLWLDAAPEVLESRAARRTGDASDATPEIVRRQLRYELGAVEWRRLDAGAGPVVTHARARAALAT